MFKWVRWLFPTILPFGFLPLIAAYVGLKVAEGVFENKAADNARDAAKAKRRIQEIQNAIARRDIVQDTYIALTRSKANAAAQGADNSTVAAGASSSIGSQFAFNLSIFDEQSNLQDTAFDKGAQSSKNQGIASVFGATASLLGASKGMFGGSASAATESIPVSEGSIFNSEYPI